MPGPTALTNHGPIQAPPREPCILTAGPVAVALAGMAFGFLVHEQIQANIEARRALGAELGL